MKVFLCLAVVLLLANSVNSYSYQQQPSYNSNSQSYDSNSQSYNKKPAYSKQQEYLACPGGKEIITSPGGGLPGSCTSNNQCAMSCNTACSKTTYDTYGQNYIGIMSTYDYARFGYCVQKQEKKENNKYNNNGYQKQSYSSKRSTSGGYQRQHVTTACKCCCDNFPTCPTSLSNYQLNTTSCNNYMDCTNACNKVSYCGVQNPTACVFTNLIGTCQCCCQPCTTVSDSNAGSFLFTSNSQIVNDNWLMEGPIYQNTVANDQQTKNYTYSFCSPVQVQVTFTDLGCPNEDYTITVDGTARTTDSCNPCSATCPSLPNPTPDQAYMNTAYARDSFTLAPGTHTVIVRYTPMMNIMTPGAASDKSAIKFSVVRGQQVCPGAFTCSNLQ